MKLSLRVPASAFAVALSLALAPSAFADAGTGHVTLRDHPSLLIFFALILPFMFRRRSF